MCAVLIPSATPVTMSHTSLFDSTQPGSEDYLFQLRGEPRVTRLAHSLHADAAAATGFGASGSAASAATAGVSSAAPSVNSSPYRTRIFRATPTGSAAASTRASPARYNAAKAQHYQQQQQPQQHQHYSQPHGDPLQYYAPTLAHSATVPSLHPHMTNGTSSSPHPPPVASSSSSSSSDPEVQAWSAHLRDQSLVHTRRIATLTSLLEEQTAAMTSLRAERNDFVQHMESARIAAAREREYAQNQLASASEQIRLLQSKDAQAQHAQSLLHNELSMLESRAREDISTLLQRVETAAMENAKLRTLYTQEKQRADQLALEKSSLGQQVDSLRTRESESRQVATKYKSKCRSLVDRVRQSDGQNAALVSQVEASVRAAEQAQEELLLSRVELDRLASERDQLARAHTKAREELLAKTRELSGVYAQMATSAAAASGSNASSKSQQQQQQTPLSQQLQVDFHSALASAQREILDLRAQLQSSHQQQQQQQQSASPHDLRELQAQLQMLRARLERKMEENIRLTTDNRELQASLEQQASKHQSQPRHHPLHSPSTPSESPHPSPHLYKQIVDLSESLAHSEQTVRTQQAELDHLATRTRSSHEVVQALQAQIDSLQSHLSEFQSRELPSREEFEREVRAREQVFEQQMQEAQRLQDDLARRGEEERVRREEMTRGKEKFVIKAIAIHSEELTLEVDSLSSLVSCHSLGVQAGIEHLVPRPPVRDSTLTLPQTEEKLSRTVEDLRTLRRGVADQYAKGLSNECITQ